MIVNVTEDIKIKLKQSNFSEVFLQNCLNSKFLAIAESDSQIIGACIFLLIQIPSIIILGDQFGINGIAVSFVLGEIAQALFLIVYEKKFMNTA